jgi:hypothetical protein
LVFFVSFLIPSQISESSFEFFSINDSVNYHAFFSGFINRPILTDPYAV